MRTEPLKLALKDSKARRPRPTLAKFIRLVPFLACLTDTEIDELEQVVTERKFSRDEVILLEEDTCKYLYIVYSGKVKVVKTGADGREHILAIHRKGEYFGEMGILDGKTSPAAVVAMENAEVGLISKEVMEKYLLTKARVLRELISVFCVRLREAWLKVKTLSLIDAESRVKAVLNLISDQYGVKDQRGAIISLKLTHKDIANYCSLSRETVTRQLLRLSEADEIAILEDKRILLKHAFFENTGVS